MKALLRVALGSATVLAASCRTPDRPVVRLVGGLRDGTGG